VTQPHAVRPARARDLDTIAPLEESGLALFEAALGDLSGTVLAGPSMSGQDRAGKDGFLLVTEVEETVVGFVHVLFLDGHAHLEQISVHPDHMRLGIGAALIEAACERLSVHGHGAVTLMTYADLPWNGPYYAKHGFLEVGDDEPRAAYQLHLVEVEERIGLGQFGRRILMRRGLRRHRTVEEMLEFLPTLDAAPQDVGTLRLIVRRPASGAREELAEGELSTEVGLVGDNWLPRGSRHSADGSALLDMQLNLTSHAMMEFLAQEEERVALAGDQLYLDLDLSHDNLPAGSELHFGGGDGAVVVVTPTPHNGCAKFINRFGREAMSFVNGPEGKPRRLRGLCAKVVRDGVVRQGDQVVVVRPGLDTRPSAALDHRE
jgi:GNAT superfamily N-acetyltransferase/MOSC domain-containing protein YiiM